jgi:hypothetical protein
MLRKEFISGGNPAKTGAFHCEATGTGAIGAMNRRDRRRIGSGKAAAGGSPAGYRVMAKVIIPDRDRLSAKGYEAFAHVPVMFDSGGRYLREHNRYLRERARLEWHPSGGGDFPRGRTLENIAERLLNFVQWCERRSADWRTVSYDDVLRYQSDQLAGRWSQKRVKLLPPTANERADEATAFLRWAEFRELRGPFDVKMFSVHLDAPRLRGLTVRQVRAGRAKEDIISPGKAGFILPEPVEVRDWLAAVRRRRGYAKYLACRFVMETGVRKKEVRPSPRRSARRTRRSLRSESAGCRRSR